MGSHTSSRGRSYGLFLWAPNSESFLTSQFQTGVGTTDPFKDGTRAHATGPSRTARFLDPAGVYGSATTELRPARSRLRVSLRAAKSSGSRGDMGGWRQHVFGSSKSRDSGRDPSKGTLLVSSVEVLPTYVGGI